MKDRKECLQFDLDQILDKAKYNLKVFLITFSKLISMSSNPLYIDKIIFITFLNFHIMNLQKKKKKTHE